MLAALYVLYKLNKWPEPSPHEVNYLFDLKSNPQHNGTGFFHFCHQETGRTFLSGTTHISNVGHYNKEYFFTPDISSNNLAFARGGTILSLPWSILYHRVFPFVISQTRLAFQAPGCARPQHQTWCRGLTLWPRCLPLPNVSRP